MPDISKNITNKDIRQAMDQLDTVKFFTDQDFRLLRQKSGTPVRRDVDSEKHSTQLKEVYFKVDFWMRAVAQVVFGNDDCVKIQRKAINQAQQYVRYMLGKIYPSEADKKENCLAYIVLISDGPPDDVFTVSIDTVGNKLDLSAFKKYRETHQIVLNIPIEEGVALGWDELIKQSAEFIISIQSHFNGILAIAGKSQKSQINKKDNGVNNIPLNQIFYGPPGTGKTFNTINEALKVLNPEFLEYVKRLKLNNKDSREKLKEQFDKLEKEGRIFFVTFHQSFSYEDFVEGIKATTEKGEISYYVAEGIFKKVCEASKKLSTVLIIDEINRGNISSIFGEIITLIEPSKREGAAEELSVKLPYSKEPFKVPKNLYLIGTMNTADRSLALMDTALRRRFDFIAMMPDINLLEDLKVGGIDVPKMLSTMNKRIAVLYDREHTLGHTFFMPLISEKKDSEKQFKMLQNIFKHKILPLLEEYFFEDWDKIRLVLGDNTKKNDENQFITLNKDDYDTEKLFGESDLDGTEIANAYSLNKKALDKENSYIFIYAS